MKTKKIKKRELILFGGWLIIVVIILVDSAIRRAYEEFSRVEEEIVLNEEKLSRLNAILTQSGEVEQGYAKVVSKSKSIADSDQLLQEIEKIAAKGNINILNIKPGAAKDEGAFKAYALKVELQDEISALAKFINALSDEFKSVGIERLQITSSNREEQPKITLSINAVVFKD